MKVRMRPMFAPDDNSGPDEMDAKIRIAIKKAREEGKRAATEVFQDMMEDAGFSNPEEFKAALKTLKRGDKNARPDDKPEAANHAKSEADLAAERAAATQAAADKAAADVKAQELYDLKLKMAVAGVKVDDLEWAANRFLTKKGDLPPSGVAAFTVDSFVTELRTATPTVFRDPPTGDQPPAGSQPPNPGATPGATGNNANPPPDRANPPLFNASKNTPEQNRARIAELTS